MAALRLEFMADGGLSWDFRGLELSMVIMLPSRFSFWKAKVLVFFFVLCVC